MENENRGFFGSTAATNVIATIGIIVTILIAMGVIRNIKHKEHEQQNNVDTSLYSSPEQQYNIDSANNAIKEIDSAIAVLDSVYSNVYNLGSDETNTQQTIQLATALNESFNFLLNYYNKNPHDCKVGGKLKPVANYLVQSLENNTNALDRLNRIESFKYVISVIEYNCNQ